MAKASKSSRKADDVKKLWKLIRRIEVAMMTTVCDDGTLRARPMMTQRKEIDGTLWFFTAVDSAKVHEVERDRHVNLTYSDPDSNTYVSVSGRASLVRSPKKEKEMWRPAYRAWFPQGLNDPSLGLIRVDVDRAEYWDSSSSAMVHLFGAVKAIVTGKRAKGGENKKIKVGMV